MSYRKFKASQVFTGTEMLSGDHVLITNQEGVIENIAPASEAGEDIENHEGILSPCFINCHCHLELSHMKGKIPEQTGMLGFVSAVMSQRNSSREEILSAMETAENEMLDNGIIAVGDICNNPLSLEQKKKGRIYYHNFIEIAGFDPQAAEQRLNSGKQIFTEFAAQYGLPIESNSIVPHAPYSVSEKLFEEIINFPGNHLLCMHNQESLAEENFFKKREGDFLSLYKNLGLDISFFERRNKSSLQSVLHHFKRNQTLILVHNVTTDAEDIKFIQSGSGLSIRTKDLHFCLCPNANLYIGNGTPRADILADSGISIVLGTDSLASNNALSILSEIKTLKDQFPQLSTSQLLQWGTINGAKALQLDEVLGSFEKGKQPGLAVIDNNLDAVKRLI